MQFQLGHLWSRGFFLRDSISGNEGPQMEGFGIGTGPCSRCQCRCTVPAGEFDDGYSDLYTIDYGDFRVKKFDADGKLVQIYGDGKSKLWASLNLPEP